MRSVQENSGHCTGDGHDRGVCVRCQVDLATRFIVNSIVEAEGCSLCSLDGDYAGSFTVTEGECTQKVTVQRVHCSLR